MIIYEMHRKFFFLSSLFILESLNYTHTSFHNQVVSIIANFEEFPPPGPITPDYKAIYRYISGMLSESELPDLGKLGNGVSYVILSCRRTRLQECSFIFSILVTSFCDLMSYTYMCYYTGVVL